MLKEINKEDIPDWAFGNVTIKTYSYGDTLALSEMMEVGGEEIIDGKKTTKYVAKSQYKENDVNLYMLAAGIHFIRNVEGTGYVLAPNMDIDIKKKVIFDINTQSAVNLLLKVKELNEVIGDELKKKSH